MLLDKLTKFLFDNYKYIDSVTLTYNYKNKKNKTKGVSLQEGCTIDRSRYAKRKGM
jgi:hypothetical protein